MSLEKRYRQIVSNCLPKGPATITYGDLRESTLILRGLSDILLLLREEGRLSFALSEDAQILDTTLIEVNEILGPDDFCGLMPERPGREILEKFRFDPATCVISVDHNGSLHVRDPGTNLAYSSGVWRRVKPAQTASA